MDNMRKYDYAFHGLDQLIRRELIDILKEVRPMIQDHILRILCFEKFMQEEERGLPSTKAARIRHCCRFYYGDMSYIKRKNPYTLANERSKQLCGLNLFSNPNDIRLCAKEHYELLRRIPEIEATEMFGPFENFNPQNAEKINGAINWDWYQRRYEEKLINRTVSGTYTAGDLISLGMYPFEYDGYPAPVKWIVLERDDNTALLLSLYSFGDVCLSTEETKSPDMVSVILNGLAENYYRAIFEPYPYDPRIIPFKDGREMSLLSIDDIERLGWDKRMYSTALPLPYDSGFSDRVVDTGWLLLDHNDGFKIRNSYGVMGFMPGCYALRPVIRIDCKKVSEYPLFTW